MTRMIARQKIASRATAAAVPHRAVAGTINETAIASSASGSTIAAAGTSTGGTPKAPTARRVAARSRNFAAPASANTPLRTSNRIDAAADTPSLLVAVRACPRALHQPVTSYALATDLSTNTSPTVRSLEATTGIEPV